MPQPGEKRENSPGLADWARAGQAAAAAHISLARAAGKCHERCLFLSSQPILGPEEEDGISISKLVVVLVTLLVQVGL